MKIKLDHKMRYFPAFKAVLGVERSHRDKEHEKDDSPGRQRRGKKHVPKLKNKCFY
jgi:hypothetical protein